MSDPAAATARPVALSYRHALRFILLIGAVSLFADMTYEGARSITGPYLAVLGASATAVGFVAGFGELIGYAVRLASGYLSDRTGRYCAVTTFGYCVNLLAVPLLALAGSWEAAAVLIVLERMGRAIRTPARDAMLSHAAGHSGLGWGFGLHEALDQTGAVLGPLALGALLYFGGDYRTGFAVLLIPALLALALLLAARLLYPRPRDFELSGPSLERGGLPRPLGLSRGRGPDRRRLRRFPSDRLPFRPGGGDRTRLDPGAVRARHGDRRARSAGARPSVRPDRPCHHDRRHRWIAPGGAARFPRRRDRRARRHGALGVGMGAQESIMRAAIARIAPAERRGTAYGIFNALYGAAWFAGSVLLGALYDRSVPALVVASVALQAASLPVLLWLVRSNRRRGPAGDA
jgi:Major Facilitator Superfamily